MSWTFGEIKSLSKIVSDVLDPDIYWIHHSVSNGSRPELRLLKGKCSARLTPRPPLLTTKSKSVVRRGGAESDVFLPSPEAEILASGEGPGVRLNSYFKRVIPAQAGMTV